MRFKLDENLPVEAAEALREAGHDAITVLEQQGVTPVPRPAVSKERSAIRYSHFESR